MKPMPWKVGEVARHTGMSVRALHHYDEIGLLRPSRRSPSGHRQYAQSDLDRLLQVQALRMMGFSLEEVQRLLDGAAPSPDRMIRLHLVRLRERIADQERQVNRLEALAEQFARAQPASVAQLCQLIEATIRMEQYFTPEQLTTLEERRVNVGEARMQEVTATWATLIPAVGECIARGDDPASAPVQKLAAQWKALVQEFTGGDPAISRAVMTMYEQEGPALAEKMGPVPTPDMFEYIGRAWAAAGS